MKRLLHSIQRALGGANPPGGDLAAGVAAFERGDYARALAILRPLATAGVPAAQHHLGMMYERGAGVVLSAADAVDWYRRAAEQGFAPAQAAHVG